MRVSATAPVVALDIDGTMGDYHSHFVWFLRHIYLPHEWVDLISPDSWLGPRPVWEHAPQGEFSEALKMEKDEYRRAKLAYRQGGLKRCMPQFPEDQGRLKEFVQGIRGMQIQVWVCTNRPWLRLDNVDPDTQYWLAHNVGRVDGLIFGEDKYADLIDHVGQNRILGVVDDLPENIQRANKLGLNAALRAQPWNRWWRNQEPTEDAVAVLNMEEILHVVRGWKLHWENK